MALRDDDDDDDAKYLTSGTYLHDPRYLELNGKCRLINVIPEVEPNHFVRDRHQIISLGCLTAQEYEEMKDIARAWFEKEIKRLEAKGMHNQVDLIREYMDTQDPFWTGELPD